MMLTKSILITNKFYEILKKKHFGGFDLIKILVKVVLKAR